MKDPDQIGDTLVNDCPAMTATEALKQLFRESGQNWAVAWLEEKPTIVNFSCDGSCSVLIEDYNKNKQRCIACPTPKRKFRKV
jgi:hypothetical protein